MRLQLTDGSRLFAKGIPASHVLAGKYRDEAAACHQLPAFITSYAAAFAGYWARSSRLPAPPGVPRLRAYQARAAQAALTWTAHRTNWP